MGVGETSIRFLKKGDFAFSKLVALLLMVIVLIFLIFFAFKLQGAREFLVDFFGKFK